MEKEFKRSMVFSGGGIRSAAQLGVLQAMLEHNVKPDLLMGTSGGAIASVLYASGFQPIVAVKMIEEFSFFKFTIPSIRSGGLIDPSIYRKQFESLIPFDNLEDLPITTYINVVDILEPRELVLKQGNIVDAVLASAAFPMVFSPLKKDGMLLADGGIINNFAVNAVRAQCDKVIGVYVNRVEKITPDLIKSPISGIIRSMNITVAVKDEKYFHLCDLLIEPELEKFNLFDKGKLRDIFEIGYEEGHQHMEQIKEIFSY